MPATVSKMRGYRSENVYEMAISRMEKLYAEGHRCVVSFSGGKDSTVTLEVTIAAAKKYGALPVDVVVQDEEIAYPGLYEFVDRVAQRPEVRMNWLNMRQPVLNVFNRAEPYFWVFDPLLPSDKWVRTPPSYAIDVDEIDIQGMTTPERFPPDPDKNLYAVIGLRTQESRGRMYGLFSSGGYTTKPNKWGTSNARPIYDWSYGDVWKAINEFKWDYCEAYNTMYRLGIPPMRLRIGPPTMTTGAIEHLQVGMQAWPQWFEKVSERLPGVRTAAQFGKRAVQPERHSGESWKEVFYRECINEAPADWIKERSIEAERRMLSAHTRHSTDPFHDVAACASCHGNVGSYKQLALALYNGDPFSFKVSFMPFVEPGFFRNDTRTWGTGKPSW